LFELPLFWAESEGELLIAMDADGEKQRTNPGLFEVLMPPVGEHEFE